MSQMMPEVTIFLPFQSQAGRAFSSAFKASSLAVWSSLIMNQAERSTVERATADTASGCWPASTTNSRRAARLRLYTLMAVRRASSVMVLPEIFSSSPFTCWYWSMVNWSPKVGLRCWGWARKMQGSLPSMATRKFWLMGRRVSQMVGVIRPSRSSRVPSSSISRASWAMVQ